MLAGWVIHSFIAMLGFSGIYILLKTLTQFSIPSSIINFYFFGIASFGFLLISLIQKSSFSVPKNSMPFFVLLSLSAILGNYYSVKAYAIAPNPGYAAAIISSAVVLFTLFSIFAFNSNFDLLKGIGVFLIICGVVILSFT